MEIGSIMLNDSTKETGQKVSVTIGKLIHVIKIWLDNEYITDLTPIKYFTTIHYKYQVCVNIKKQIVYFIKERFWFIIKLHLCMSLFLAGCVAYYV